MENNLTYITGNKMKFEVASQVFKDTGIILSQKKLDTPEIQSKSVEDVAIYSAVWACKELNQSVFVTDAGFCIEALKGFPGPFIKYTNEWFSAEDYLNLMQGKSNRNVIIKDCLAYCKPNEKPIVFTGSFKGTLAIKSGKRSGTSIEQLFIPEGFDRPISEIPAEEMIDYWSKGDILLKFKKVYLKHK